MSTPATNLRRQIHFCTLAGVKSADLADNSIVGRFRFDGLDEFFGPKAGTLIQEFVNWPSNPTSWLKFVRKYGPIWEDAEQGAEFRSDIAKFSEAQDTFRRLWRDKKRSGWQVGGQVAVSHLQGKATVRVSNLHWFLFLDVVTLDPRRLKVCKCPECPAPYFVASHLGQRFCSTDCSDWSQKQLKKDWWRKNGEKWRANQPHTSLEANDEKRTRKRKQRRQKA